VVRTAPLNLKKMTKNEQQQWQKIADFELDKPHIGLTFSQRLAKENGFSETFAKQIVEEYKKFIFLCCVSAKPVSPSYYVDLAWHLHLTYTQSYWINLCQNTLQKDIHHSPTEGGNAEAKKFKGYFIETLALYEQKFQQKPPLAIWTNTPNNQIVAVNKNENWVIPKIKLANIKPRLIVLLKVLMGSSLLIGCSSGGQIAFIAFSFFAFLFIIFSAIFSKKDSHKHTHNSAGSCSSSSDFSHDSSHGHDSHGHSADGDYGDSDGGSDAGDSGGDGGSSCSSCGGGGD
jgi:hypothetical protein